jgi:hypothetical protein
VEFCRDNTHFKVLTIEDMTLFDKDSSISVSPQDGPQDSSAILALDRLTVTGVTFEESNVATKFLNFIAHVTYPVLELGGINFGWNYGNDGEDKKNARLRIVSELIKPSVEQLTLRANCRIEVMDVIEACATVTQIQLCPDYPPDCFMPTAVQRKLQAIVTRNRELARFVANPRSYPGSDLLALMSKFYNSPTGRYMLACCFPGIPSFFKIKSTDSSAGSKKRRRTY